MAQVRVTVGRRPRTPGTQVGIRLNTFGMNRLQAEVDGDALAQIAYVAYQPAFDEAVENWPVWTGASRDSISLDVVEVGPRFARVALQAGGEKLKSDSRNRSGKDYAPYIEFNGTRTAPPGILLNAVSSRDREIRDEIHSEVSALIRRILI